VVTMAPTISAMAEDTARNRVRHQHLLPELQPGRAQLRTLALHRRNERSELTIFVFFAAFCSKILLNTANPM
jgi:hypothetical protein